MNPKNWKLGTKQRTGFGLILIIMVGVNIYSINRTQAIKREIDEVSLSWLPRAVALANIKGSASDLRTSQLQRAVARDEARQDLLNATIIDLIDQIDHNVSTYDSLKSESIERGLYSAKEDSLYTAFDDNWGAYQDVSFEFFELSGDNKNNEAVELLNNEGQRVFDVFSGKLKELVEVNKNDSFAAAARADFAYRSARNVTIILLIVTIIISIFLADFLVRYITGPVQQLERAAGAVARGNLDLKLDILSDDEVGNLAVSFNDMTKALRNAHEERERKSQELHEKNVALQKANDDLEDALQQLHEAQEQLLVKEKMASLGDLVAGLAHELNNPIGAVTASSDIALRSVGKIVALLKKSREDDEPPSTEKLQRLFKILEDNVKVTSEGSERVVALVNSLKKFARLDEAEYQIADLHEGLDETLNILESEINGEITIEKEYGDLPKIACYPGLLNQVFLSLLKNAASAIDAAGRIEIETFFVSENVHVRISDTGKGIPPEKLKRLFEFSFSKDEQRVKMSSGLSSAMSIVKKHDGEIEVESKVGEGSAFTVILPVKTV